MPRIAAIATVATLCRMVKIEHSVFALPFAFMGLFAAHGGWPPLSEALLLALGMVCIRSFAMTFNRIVDVYYDSLNPRTATRPLVTGELSRTHAWIFCGITALGFVLSTVYMNRLCLMLSPVALFVAAFYSYTKRFTWLCHVVLGLMLAMAPMAGWLCAIPHFTLPPMLLAAGVLFWVAGFDIFYACQDVDFDTRYDLHSAPVHFGIPTALILAAFCHVNTVIFFFLAGIGFAFDWPWYATLAAIAALLCWEHALVKPDDLSRVNMAFFVLNGCISVALFLGLFASIFMGK